MNEKNVNKTHLHISNTTKIPITRKASNNKLKTFNENTEHRNVEVQGQHIYTSLKQLILGVLTLQFSISDGLIIKLRRSARGSQFSFICKAGR